MNPSGPAVNFVNVGYFFQLIYNLAVSGKVPTVRGINVLSFISTLWFWVCLLAYLITFLLIGVLTYYTIRLHQVAEEIDHNFETIPEPEAHEEVEHSRWKRIRELIESPMESDWRAAIIEADIMLDEMLTRIGYQGNSVGDKLKTANPAHFHTLQEAWEAHTVRNEIAHQGTNYQLSPNIAYRTIGKYENVFREFNEI